MIFSFLHIVLMDFSLTFQRFQKDAILRQMQEYKRDKASLETRLKDMSKAAVYHNDHLRVIDAWFRQVSTQFPDVPR